MGRPPSRKASTAAFVAIARLVDSDSASALSEPDEAPGASSSGTKSVQPVANGKKKATAQGKKKKKTEVAIAGATAEGNMLAAADPAVVTSVMSEQIDIGNNSSSSKRPTRARTSSSKAVASQKQQVEDRGEDEADDESELSSELSDVPAPPPKKKRRAATNTKKGKAKEEPDAVEDGEQDAAATAKPKRKRKGKKKAAAEDEDEEGDELGPGSAEEKKPTTKAKRTRKPKVTEPIVYDIPDITAHRDFASEAGPTRAAGPYTGRLGYACLNTILRAQKPSVFSSRTTRIKSIEEKGLGFVKELALANVRDIVPMVEWNEAHGIKFMRLSSEMFPFATHSIYGYDFISFAREELERAGAVARKYGHRITMHPGQFCQLGTPKPDVLEASIRELDMHAQILDGLGMDQDSVMILHGGGVYEDREGTVARIRETIAKRLSPSARARLVLENDELAYSVEELLPICKDLKVPLVLDFHHDMLRPSSRPTSELIPEILEIWKERGIRPKFHLSEPRPGAKKLRERRAHSDRCTHLPADLPPDADLMIEAKDKEQAVFELFRIYNLVDVKPFWSDLRPPATEQGTATAGRKRSAAVNDTSTSMSDQAKALRTLIKAKKVERRIERKKAIAEGRTPPPEGDSDLDGWTPAQDRPPVTSQVDVLEEMRVEADLIRTELREGRGRRPYGGVPSSDGEDEVDGADEDEVRVVNTADEEDASMTEASPSKPSKLRIDGQAGGAQEDLVAVVDAGPSATSKSALQNGKGKGKQKAGITTTTTTTTAGAPSSLGAALVVKPGVEAEPSAEATPLDVAAAVAVQEPVGSTSGASTAKGRKRNSRQQS